MLTAVCRWRHTAGGRACGNYDDIDPFLVALQGQEAYETAYPDCNWLHADIDGDGDVDLDDLDVFVNLLSSGNAALWVAYTWDAENRLIGVAPGGTPKSGDLKLAFVYDYMGRRVQKKVWTWDPQAGQGGDWVLTEHRKFVWNGWLLLMELDGLNDDAVLRKRTWGLDLSGLTGGASSAGLASSRSMLEGAGGIGGLLAVHDATIGQNGADYVYFYDANGNVGQVCDLSHTPSDPAGAIVARYEYDPYGNVTSQSGAYASANPFRFSTKYWDDETGLGYWGYRYYDPKLGRWVNRDPIDELGGRRLAPRPMNARFLPRDRVSGLDWRWRLVRESSLYAAFGSDPAGRWDPVGLCVQGTTLVLRTVSKSCGFLFAGEKTCNVCSYCVCGDAYPNVANDLVEYDSSVCGRCVACGVPWPPAVGSPCPPPPPFSGEVL